MTPPSSISTEISSMMYCSIKNDLNIYSKTVMKLEKIKIDLNIDWLKSSLNNQSSLHSFYTIYCII